MESTVENNKAEKVSGGMGLGHEDVLQNSPGPKESLLKDRGGPVLRSVTSTHAASERKWRRRDVGKLTREVMGVHPLGRVLSGLGRPFYVILRRWRAREGSNLCCEVHHLAALLRLAKTEVGG